jgi:hypothetical protein
VSGDAMTRQAAAHRSTQRRRTIRTARSEGAAQAIGPVTPGIECFVLTHGQFSLIDALVYLSQQIGPCDLSVSTWTAGAEDLGAMANLLAGGQFRSVRWLVDRSFVTRQPAYCARLRELFGDDVIRTTRSHAKFVTLRNDGFTLAVRTSMNLNHNPRLENIEISDDPALCQFLDAEFDRYFAEQVPGTMGAEMMEDPPAPAIRAGRATGNRLYPRAP